MLETGLYNMDCMDGMKMFPDKFFDLAIVDPPYGNLEYWGFETHKGYFDMATKRLEAERAKIKLFSGND